MKRIVMEVIAGIIGGLLIACLFCWALVHNTDQPEHRQELPAEEKRALHSTDKQYEVNAEYVAGIGLIIAELPEKEPVDVVTTQARYTDWNIEDFKTLTHLVMAEAEGEPLEGKIAVVNVVLNRCRNRGQSIQEVVFAEGQFCSSGKRFELKPNEECYDAVVAALLDDVRVIPDEIDNAGKATKLLERLDKRRQEGLTTPKQIRFLEGRGFQHVGTWQFDSAKKLIDRIAANGWRVPQGIAPSQYKEGD